jgi:nucleoside-diphosphate-sugar epimerase
MRVLILGGTGFIGPHVVKQLVDLGCEVTVFHRGQTESDLPLEVHHIHCDTLTFGDRRALRNFEKQLKQFAPEVVLDMIPMTEQDAKILMSTFDGIAKRVVVISSQDVYRAYGLLQNIETGDLEPFPISEEAPLRQKMFPYRGESPRDQGDSRKWLDTYDKILVERAVMGNHNLPGTVLRLPMVYGPGDRQHRFFADLKRMEDGRPAILLDQRFAHWRWTRGYVEDVARAICLAVTNQLAIGRIYNVGEADALPMIDWTRAIGEAVGWSGRIVTLPKDELPTHLRVNINFDQHLVVDTTRIRAELGFKEIVTREEAIQHTVIWERSHPPEIIDPDAFNYSAENKALDVIEQMKSFPTDSL